MPSCGCMVAILAACCHKQVLLSADIADRVPESSETGAITASVKIGSSPSKSLGLLRPETWSYAVGKLKAWSEPTGWGTSSMTGQKNTQHLHGWQRHVVTKKLSRPCMWPPPTGALPHVTDHFALGRTRDVTKGSGNLGSIRDYCHFWDDWERQASRI